MEVSTGMLRWRKAKFNTVFRRENLIFRGLLKMIKANKQLLTLKRMENLLVLELFWGKPLKITLTTVLQMLMEMYSRLTLMAKLPISTRTRKVLYAWTQTNKTTLAHRWKSTSLTNNTNTKKRTICILNQWATLIYRGLHDKTGLKANITTTSTSIKLAVLPTKITLVARCHRWHTMV